MFSRGYRLALQRQRSIGRRGDTIAVADGGKLNRYVTEQIHCPYMLSLLSEISERVTSLIVIYLGVVGIPLFWG